MDANNPNDLAAARAYVWATFFGPISSARIGQGRTTTRSEPSWPPLVAVGKSSCKIEAEHDALCKRNPEKTRADVLRQRMQNTPWIPRELLEKIPVGWGPRP